jgi:hypothetical protein
MPVVAQRYQFHSVSGRALHLERMRKVHEA